LEFLLSCSSSPASSSSTLSFANREAKRNEKIERDDYKKTGRRYMPAGKEEQKEERQEGEKRGMQNSRRRGCILRHQHSSQGQPD
jgi:hypothetical protein